jgi:flagellar protein FliO/FliZ
MIMLAAAPIGSPSDSRSIRTAPGGSRVSATQPMAMPSLGVDVTRMLMALAIVIGLIYAARWFVKRFYNGSVMPAGSRVVQVLNRTVLAPKQQILLLQVGKRVVVVGESNGNLTTLAQIEDADEIAQLTGRLQEERAGKSTGFSGMFGRAQSKMAEEPAETNVPLSAHDVEDSTPDAIQMKSELSGLLDKVRSIRGQIDRE